MALTAIHPGEHLAEELEALDMSAAELARKINVPTNRITQILSGTRAITGDTALRLAHFFGTSAQFWLNLQSLNELRLAQEKIGKSIKALPTLKRRELVHARRVNARNSGNDGPRPANCKLPDPISQSAFYLCDCAPACAWYRRSPKQSTRVARGGRRYVTLGQIGSRIC